MSDSGIPGQPPPPNQPPPPQPPPPQPPAPPIQPPGPPAEPPSDSKKPWWKKWWVIAIGIFVLLIVIASAAGAGSDEGNESSADEPSNTETRAETEAPDEAATTEGAEAPAEAETPEATEATEPQEEAEATGEAADVGPCTVLDEDTIVFDVTNNSSKQSSYFVDVNFRDDAGERLADETVFVNYVRPGETAREEQFVFDSAGGTTCEIAEVERFAAESSDDVNEVTCEVTGLDFADDIETRLVATNGSSKLSDYSISVAIVRDGIRIGTALGFIENVAPGESAPGDGFSTAPGPLEGTTCETVSVDRTDSSS